MSSDERVSRRWTSDAIAKGCAALLLLGALACRLALPNPSDAVAYHDKVRAAAAGIPLETEKWESKDIPVPSEAMSELRPNVIISRRLHNKLTGTDTSLLLVQCRDVRDLAPHYPPVCYPGQGLTLTSQSAIQLQTARGVVHATRYTFEANNYRHGGVLHVDNFMILPDGAFQADMQGMERRIGASQRYFGAAQVQIVHGDNLSSSEQTADSEQILVGYKPLIDAICDGTRK